MFKEIAFTDVKENVVDLLKNQWALVTAGDKNGFNPMTVSWGAVGELWAQDMATIYIRPQRYTVKYLEEQDYFTISVIRRSLKNRFTAFAAQKAAEIPTRQKKQASHLFLTKKLLILRRQNLFLFAARLQRASSNPSSLLINQSFLLNILKTISTISITVQSKRY